jgi:hypothetical protein
VIKNLRDATGLKWKPILNKLSATGGYRYETTLNGHKLEVRPEHVEDEQERLLVAYVVYVNGKVENAAFSHEMRDVIQAAVKKVKKRHKA